jgi:hypothetical protein
MFSDRLTGSVTQTLRLSLQSLQSSVGSLYESNCQPRAHSTTMLHLTVTPYASSCRVLKSIDCISCKRLPREPTVVVHTDTDLSRQEQPIKVAIFDRGAGPIRRIGSSLLGSSAAVPQSIEGVCSWIHTPSTRPPSTSPLPVVQIAFSLVGDSALGVLPRRSDWAESL